MPKISACLWFDDQAEEAAKFYTSIFKNSKIVATSHYSKEGAEVSGRPEGSVMTVEFEIEGQPFTALNGGPIFKFSEAISFMVHCKNQEEIDYYWEKMSAHPENEQCGWLKDQFGVSWQIIPAGMKQMMQDPKKSQNVMKAMLKMKKIDMKKLQEAAGK